jgi:hypothetical protein
MGYFVQHPPVAALAAAMICALHLGLQRQSVIGF